MTGEEARRVMAICNQTDGGCYVCARRLRDELIAAFPEHAHNFRAAYAAEHGDLE